MAFRDSLRYLVLILLAAGAALLGAVLLLEVDDRPVRTSLAVSDALSGDTAGYAKAVDPRSFHFPADHGPHPDFRVEWWYYTGNLIAGSGRRFGYQLTIFRTSLRPPSDAPFDSTWNTRQLYMAHFALSDVRSEAFYAFERFSRGAAGLAGATAQPYRVWLEDWTMEGETADSVRLRAEADGIAIDLALRRTKPVVLQGANGLDRKSSEPGNASYYYSMTRMRTSGTVSIRGERHAVTGLSWLDREWSTSALGDEQLGWDWFSLQLHDGRDVMFYRLRRRDGTTSPFSSGVIVGADGAVRRLFPDDVRLQPTRFWDSPASGISYPVEWSMRIPVVSLDLDLIPYLDGQELTHSVTYWEGAVRIAGRQGGSGFVELTGYGDREETAGGRLQAEGEPKR